MCPDPTEVPDPTSMCLTLQIDPGPEDDAEEGYLLLIITTLIG